MTSPAATLEWLTTLLDQLAIPHMVVGSFASSAHGVPRTTHDIDVEARPRHPQGNSAWRGGTRSAHYRTVAGVRAPLATAEDVIIAKLLWARDSGSARQLADVAGIVVAKGLSLDRPYLERWISELGLDTLWHRAQAATG